MIRRVLAALIAGAVGAPVYWYFQNEGGMIVAGAVIMAAYGFIDWLGVLPPPYEPDIRSLLHPSKKLSTEQAPRPKLGHMAVGDWDSVVHALRTQLDEDDERHIQMCDALLGFIHEGGSLIQRCILEKGSRDVEMAYHDWSCRATEYMKTAMGKAFVQRFKDASDWVFGDVPPGGYPLDRLGLYNDVRARTYRLQEFFGVLIPRARPVSELRRPPWF